MGKTHQVTWRLIGDVAILIDGRRADLNGRRQHEVLALLLTRAGQPVPFSEIAQELWGDKHPKTARNSVQRFVADIRRAHGEHASLLQTSSLGYRLDAQSTDVDVGQARVLMSEAAAHQKNDRSSEARTSLLGAVDLLSGAPFAGFRRLPFVVVAEAEIDELSTHAVERLAELELELGFFEEARGRLSAHVATHPFQEVAAGQLMRGLYQLGRQRDALATYEQIRCNLRDELGLLPSPELQELHSQILNHDLHPVSSPAPTPGIATGSPSAADDRTFDHTPNVPLPAQLQPAHGALLRKDIVANVQNEIEQMVDRGRTRAVMIGAEPGSGKSTVLAQIGAQLQATGWCVLYGRSRPSDSSPYTEWSSVLEHVMAHCPSEYRASCVEPYRRSFDTITGDVAAAADEGVQSGPRSRADTFADVVSSLTTLGRAMPVLVILDDLQWSNRSALDLLDFVATHAEGRVAVLGSFRDNELHPAHPLDLLISDPAFASQSSIITLPRLGIDDTATLLEHGGISPTTSDGVQYVEAVHQRSGGNAFFIAELARSLATSPTVDQRDIDWLPSSIRRVVRARLDVLHPNCLELLRAASILGDTVDLPIVTSTLGWTSSAVIDALQTALRADLLIETPDGIGRFRFTHDLVRETLHDDLPRVVAARLHERAADALLTQESMSRAAGQICKHLLESGNISRTNEIVSTAQRAGELANAQLAYGEARSWFELAIEQLAALEEREPADPHRQLSLAVAVGNAMRRMGDAAHRDVLLEAGELAHELGAEDLLIEVAKSNHLGTHSESFASDTARIAQIERALNVVDDNSADHALLLALLTVESTFLASLEQRVADSAKSVEMARTFDDPSLLCQVLTLRQTAIQAPNTLALREAETAEAVALASSVTDLNLKWWAHDTRTRALGELGRFDDIDSELRAMHEISEVLNQPLLNWMQRWHQAALHLALDRVDEAEVDAEAARAIGASIDEPDTDATYGAAITGALIYRGQVSVVADLLQALLESESVESNAARLRALLAFCLSDLGNPDAWRVLEPDIANGFNSFHRDMTWSTSMVGCAEALATTASADLCRQLYDTLTPFAGSMAHSGPLFFGPIDRVLGQLAARLGDPIADTHLTNAATAMEKAGAGYWLARVRVDMLKRDIASTDERATWKQQVLDVSSHLDNQWLAAQAARAPSS